MLSSSQKMFFEFGAPCDNDESMEQEHEEEDQPHTSICDLSPEILVIVLSFLPIEDLSRLARVNSEWLLITQDKALWLPYCLKIGALHKKPKLNPEDADEYEDMDEIMKAKCVDTRVVERNWEKNKYFVQVLRGHSGSVRGVSYAEDLLVSASEDGTAKLWRISSGKCLRNIYGHSGWVYTAQCGNGVAVTGSQDRKIKLWQFNEYFISTCMHTFTGHEQSVLTLQFDNLKVVSGSSDKSIRVWDINTGQLTSTLLGHTDSIYSVQMNGDEVISGSADYTAKIWDLRIGDTTASLTGHKNSVNCVKNAPHLGRIYTASSDLTIGVWDTATLQPRYLDGHVWHVHAVEVVGEKLISASGDKSIRVWDVNSERCTNKLEGHFDFAVVALQADSRKIVAGSYDKSVKAFHFGKPFC